MLIAFALAAISVSAVAAASWLVYRFGLSQIEGRPAKAMHTANPEQIEALFKRLKISQSDQSDPVSPYTYFLQGARPNSNTRIAWIVASSYNVGHLTDRRMLIWHLSGMALTVWLTRNWTPTELIAKAIELKR